MPLHAPIRGFAWATLALAVVHPDAAGADLKDAAQKTMAAVVSVEMMSPAKTDSHAGGATPPTDSSDAYARSSPDGGSVLLGGVPQSDSQAAFASGAIVSADGLIVTVDLSRTQDAAWHVVLSDGRRLSAKTLVTDHRSGLRLLKVDAGDLPFVEMAEGEAEVGQQVMTAAVDHGKHVRYVRMFTPRYLSVGIVSAVGRRFERISAPLIQTDVRSGTGGAGSPLTDEQGRLVGIILAVEGAEPGQGVTLAVPARYVSEMLQARRGENTVVIHAAYLGVQLQTPEEGEGVVIAKVFEDTPAAKSELQQGDLIISVDGEDVASAEEVSSLLGEHVAGDEVTLTIRRGDETHDIRVSMGRRETAPVSPQQPRGQTVDIRTPGVYRVVPLSGELTWSEYEKAIKSAFADLQARQSQQPGAAVPPTPRLTGQPEMRLEWRQLESATPLTLYVQRPNGDRRLDQLTEEVKSLREDVQKLTEQLQAIAEKLQEK